MVEPLLAVSGLKTYFPIGNRWLGKQRWFKAVDDVDLAIRPGETLGLVGGSGSGKTTVGRSVLRLVEPNAGSVSFDGTNVLALNPRDLRALRPRMQIIFQDAFGSLNPRMRIRQIVGEPLRHFDIVPRHEVEDKVVSLLDRVGIEPDIMARFPHELSGGQRQRIVLQGHWHWDPTLLWPTNQFLR